MKQMNNYKNVLVAMQTEERQLNETNTLREYYLWAWKNEEEWEFAGLVAIHWLLIWENRKMSQMPSFEAMLNLSFEKNRQSI